MEIKHYKSLISSLPVREQSFLTKRSTWKKAEKEIESLERINNHIFGKSSSLSVSRKDIFNKTDIKEKIILSIYWGYPRGMRGNHFINLIKQVDDIVKTLKKLLSKKLPDANDFHEMIKSFDDIDGLGLSTYSKILYFNNISFNRNPCLILDQKLINVFNNQIFTQFSDLSNINYNTATNNYLQYLELMKKTASELESQGENIEQFLFIFGNNLKR